jgi:L-alanine-DL-glutamate epimerase-like enolase superfamily enzyme
MEPILKRPLTRRDGFAIPFDAPGHGIELDPEAMERFTVSARASLQETR